MENITAYVQEINKLYASGHATEHTYRPALQGLIESILTKEYKVINEPKRQKCGAPDYIVSHKNIDIGFIEAKDIGRDLNKVEKGGKDDDQWERYSTSLENLILTDYMEFRFFLNGEKTDTVSIAEIKNGKIVTIQDGFARFINLIKDFSLFQGQTIKSPKKLAEIMAHKAALMRDVFYKVVTSEEDSTLKTQLSAFKEILMHDMDEAQFADVYAQTVAYGLFTARLHDKTPENFSRGESLTLIPNTNPFLQKLFQYVAGADLDTRVEWIVNSLCEVYKRTDTKSIIKDFNAGLTGRNDPVIHFYETFLSEYNPKLRKSRGVWYTPEPVVKFIVRAVDDVLKEHFGLKDGLADTSKVEIEVDKPYKGKTIKGKDLVHKVQILDVATGTGTFLAEIIKHIYSKFKEQEGMWPDYVGKDLLPRLHGFELLIASYAMCHLKLDMILRETGYDSAKSLKRLSVYLTNSLEEYHKDSELPFANWLSVEANEASRIKRDIPIMIAIGNPPYSGISSNMNSWIAKNKIEDYKYVDGKHFGEKKHWLNDDYVQFIRLGEHYIEKNGDGVLAYITNHGYLDNPTFRGMRWHIANTFDKIYVLELNGEQGVTTPNNVHDENVFDIKKGVSIIIAIKTGPKTKGTLANIKYAELFGDRDSKYDFLINNDISSVNWADVDCISPYYYFKNKDNSLKAEYEDGININELFIVNGVGVMTMCDKFTIWKNKDELYARIKDFIEGSYDEQQLSSLYDMGKNYPAWIIGNRKKIELDSSNVVPITYRPFDNQYIYYEKNVVWRLRDKCSANLLGNKNISLISARSNSSGIVDHFFISRFISEAKTGESSKQSSMFPLYTYEKIGELEEKRANLDSKIYKSMKKIVPKIIPESLLHYIYAILYCPTYRSRYAEFLKSDFPRIPYPKNEETFNKLAKLGEQIIQLHLMESDEVEKFITSYPIGGEHEVKNIKWEDTDKKLNIGKVWINETQYFDKVPKIAWEFYIGGYQPAQKWLKDRKSDRLSSDDIKHYQKIIVILTRTDELMKEIDKIDFLPETN